MRSPTVSLAFVVLVMAGATAHADESCTQALNALGGQDNSQNDDSLTRRSVVKGNWSESCTSQQFMEESCSLSAACNNGQRQLQPRSTIDLKSCAASHGEVRNLGGQLVCWCAGPNTVCPPVPVTRPAIIPDQDADPDGSSY